MGEGRAARMARKAAGVELKAGWEFQGGREHWSTPGSLC